MKPTSKTSKDTPAKKEAAKSTSSKPAALKAAVPVRAEGAAKGGSAKAVTSKSAASKPVANKTASKKAPATTGQGNAMPTIDTNLAAQTAAAMVRNRPATEGAGHAEPGKESSAFKNLKDQLAKPKPAGLSNLFGPTGDQKKGGGHFNLHQQRGHNQTFGGMNKTGVPRRTNG